MSQHDEPQQRSPELSSPELSNEDLAAVQGGAFFKKGENAADIIRRHTHVIWIAPRFTPGPGARR